MHINFGHTHQTNCNISKLKVSFKFSLRSTIQANESMKYHNISSEIRKKKCKFYFLSPSWQVFCKFDLTHQELIGTLTSI